MNYETARYHMIEQQLRTCEVLAPQLVAQLYADRRENYVPDAYRNLAFADVAIPLGQGAAMLTPKLEARLLREAAVQPHERVLEIGAGSGHLAALLAEQAEQVWTVEIDPALAARARANLDNDGVTNVTVEVGDGLAGLPAAVANNGPFDVIVLSGGVTAIPAALREQLKTGGRLLAFVGNAPLMSLRRLTRVGTDAVTTADLMETVVPMLREPVATDFAF